MNIYYLTLHTSRFTLMHLFYVFHLFHLMFTGMLMTITMVSVPSSLTPPPLLVLQMQMKMLLPLKMKMLLMKMLRLNLKMLIMMMFQTWVTSVCKYCVSGSCECNCYIMTLCSLPCYSLSRICIYIFHLLFAQRCSWQSRWCPLRSFYSYSYSWKI